MAEFIRGEVVVLPFPFSDLSGSKRRPAFVLRDLPGDDIILCQITSRQFTDAFSINLTDADFERGGLSVDSCIRASRIFTADKRIILRRAGKVNTRMATQVIDQIVKLLKM